MESASLSLLLLLAGPIGLFTRDVSAARDASSNPGVKLQQLERLQQYQHQQQEGRKLLEEEEQGLENEIKSIHADLSKPWEKEKQVLENKIKSIHADLRSERLQWMEQQQALEKYVKTLAAEFKSEKQEWLVKTQTLENKAESLQAEVQDLSLKVHALENTLSGLTSPRTAGEKHAAEDKERNMESSSKQTQHIEKRFGPDTLDISYGGITYQRLETKMVHELRALNTTLTHDVQQLRTQMTSCQTAVTSATHDLDLMQNQLTAVKQTAFIALREASHVQSVLNQSGGSSLTSESQLKTVNERIDSEVRGMNQRLDGATKTLQDELVLIVKVLNAKTDTEVNRLTAEMVSQTGSLTHTVAIATQGVREISSRLQAVDSRVQAIEQSVTRQDTTIQRAGGSVYTRWGKVACHKDTQLVYQGIMAGGDKASGSMLCLPSELAFTQLAQSAPRDHSQILGADFQTSGTLQQHEQLSCAVCQPPRSTTITVPATSECPHGWTREYHGHLISGAPDSAPHDLFCMDDQPRSHSDPVAAVSVSVSLYYTVIACGSLPCNKYPNGTVVTCAVCSL